MTKSCASCGMNCSLPWRSAERAAWTGLRMRLCGKAKRSPEKDEAPGGLTRGRVGGLRGLVENCSGDAVHPGFFFHCQNQVLVNVDVPAIVDPEADRLR